MADNNGGIGVCGLTFITFLVLKLCGVISWSWWWVTAPLWLPVTAVLTICLLIILVCAIISGILDVCSK